MDPLTPNDLLRKSCSPCEGGVPPISPEEAHAMMGGVPGWELTDLGTKLTRKWVTKGFMPAIEFFQKVAELAEQEGHHPDLCLEGYRHVTIRLWTHAIGGLSENDFILAAKISELPVAEKRTPDR